MLLISFLCIALATRTEPLRGPRNRQKKEEAYEIKWIADFWKNDAKALKEQITDLADQDDATIFEVLKRAMFKDYKSFGSKLSKNGLLQQWTDIIHRITESQEYLEWRDDPNSSNVVNRDQKVGISSGVQHLTDEEITLFDGDRRRKLSTL